MSSAAWHDQAACQGEELLLFFGREGERLPEREAREQQAKQLCCGCPVIRRCRETAFELKMDRGVWGGLGEEERPAKRRTWLKNKSRTGVRAT